MGGSGMGQNGGGGIGGIGEYMAQGQQPSGFGSGVSLGSGGPPNSFSGGGGMWGVTPGAGLGPWMGNIQSSGLLLNNPQLMAALGRVFGGAGGGAVPGAGGPTQHTGGPYRHIA